MPVEEFGSIEKEAAEDREESPERIVSVKEVPDWHREPGTPLWEFGKKIESFSVSHEPETLQLPEEILELRKKLEKKESETFFSDRFANVEEVKFEGGRISIKTKETDFFSYITSSYFFRDHQKDNPVRPLATQATLITPDGRKIILERRSAELTDFPEKLSVFGGVLKPGEDPEEALTEILGKKLKLDLTPEQIKPTGFGRDNINNIYCAFFAVHLTEEQYKEGRERIREQIRAGEKMMYQVSAEKKTESVERMLLGKRDITGWEPLGYYNVLYALAAGGYRTPEEIKSLVEEAQEKVKTKVSSYTYPMKNI